MAHQHRLAVSQRDYGARDVVQRGDAPLALDQVFLSALNVKTGGGVLVAIAQCLHHFTQGQVVGRQALGLHRHLKLHGVATDGHHIRHAGNSQDAPLQHLFCGIPELHSAVAVGGQRDEQDLAHDRGGRRHRRDGDAGGQGGACQLQALGDHLPGLVQVGAPLELDDDHRQAGLGGRADAAHSRRTV
jgi:hypothetical protein